MGLYFNDFYTLHNASQTQKDSIGQLNYQSLPELDTKLFTFRNLRQLHIADCSFSQIPEGLASLSKLVHITISNSLIECLPKDFIKLNILNSLYLVDCLISDLPAQLWHKAGLREIHLEDLPLREKRIQLGRLPNLKNLAIIKCGLARFEADFAQLTQLTTLDLSQNKLRSFPDGIANAVELRHIDVSNNPIAIFPPEILTMPNLTGLRCTNVEAFHSNFQNPKLNTSYYASVRALKADTNFAFSLYLLLSADENQCENIPISHLLRALAAKTSTIADTAHQILQKKSVAALQKIPINSTSKLLLLGRLASSRDLLQNQLEQLNITLQTKRKADTTHIIIGKNITATQAQEIEAANLPFLFEPALENYLKTTGVLAFADGQQPLEDQKIQEDSLLQLLQSGDLSSIQLALEIVKANGLPSALLTDIFALYNATELPSALRTQLGKLLYRNASPTLWEKSQKKRNIFGGIFNPKALAFCLEGTELDLNKLIAYGGRFCKARPPRPATCFQLFPKEQRADYLRGTADLPYFFDIVGVERELQKWVLSLNVLKKIQYRRDSVFYDELFACDNIEELVIDYNAKAAKRLAMLPALPKLKYLRAWGINLKTVPSVFYAMPQLKTIDVRFNEIPHSAVDFEVYDETTFMHTGILTRLD